MWPALFVGGQSLRRALQVKAGVGRTQREGPQVNNHGMSGLALAGILTVGCGGAATPTAASAVPTEVPQWAVGTVQLCGFPEGQLDLSKVGPPSYLTAVGRLRLGQRMPVGLIGDAASRIKTITWHVDPGYGRTNTHAAFTSTSQSSATLVGLAVSRDDNDYDFAFARVVFTDGTDRNLVVSVCTSSEWRPADQIVVVP